MVQSRKISRRGKLSGSRKLSRRGKRTYNKQQGGSIQDDILRKVDDLRERDGDFDDQQLKELTGAELVAKMRSLRKASDGYVSLDDAAKFGKDLINARRISAFNDEIIKEISKVSDKNLLEKLILVLSPEFKLNLKEYLSKSMIQTFGGNVVNWVLQKLSLNTVKPDSKLELTISELKIIPDIFIKIAEKYPDIDLSNKDTQQLITKDFLKKIYYLNELEKQGMSGGYDRELEKERERQEKERERQRREKEREREREKDREHTRREDRDKRIIWELEHPILHLMQLSLLGIFFSASLNEFLGIWGVNSWSTLIRH